MFRLMLLRHAKSDWTEPKQEDSERPLNGRGRRAAPLLGQKILSQDQLPDRVLCSTAVRAQETWNGLIEAWPDDEVQRIEVLFLSKLYLASPATILQTADEYQTDCNALLVVGHNPGMELLASQLANQPIVMKTAHLVIFEAEPGWPKNPSDPVSWHLTTNQRGESD